MTERPYRTQSPAMMFRESFAQAGARWLYTIFFISLLPFAAGYLLWRGLRQPDYFRHWAERFLGLSSDPDGLIEGQFITAASRPNATMLWVHAVSVGETRAAAPIIDRWLSESNNHYVLLTHTTPTGRATGRTLFQAWTDGPTPRLIQRYLPYDLPWAVGLFLRRYRPALGVLIETELWPNLIHRASQLEIPVALVNARLSPRSAQRLARFALLACPALAKLSGIAAQTSQDAARFVGLMDKHGRHFHDGDIRDRKIAVTGNLKFDVAIPESQLVQGADWRKSWPHRAVWLVASSRDDEEQALLDQWRSALSAGRLSDALLIIVPRHPQRFERVAGLIRASGLRGLRRSETVHLDAQTQVFLGDSLGEMFAYIQASDLVLMGGSLIPLGGQNPIEACSLGRPVLFGPHMFNFRQIADALQDAGAGIRVSGSGQWLERGSELLADPAAYQQASEAARQFAISHKGACNKTLDVLSAILPTGR